VKHLVVLLVVLLGFGSASAHAQAGGDANWPDRPIRLIIPFPAGASSDVVGRILMQKLGPRLGQQIVVENRPGASGNLGADMVAKAAPDGYTMGLITGSTHAVAPALGANLPYDPIKDFKPVSMIGAAPYVLVIYPGLAAQNLAELIALAKAKPGTLNYGSAGPASLAHLGTAQFATQVGIDITHVPYKSSAQSLVDMITGRLDMQVATIAPVLQNIRGGQLRALATTGKRRVSALPDTPTMMEAGVANYELVLWMALVMPAATPEATVAKLNSEFNAVLNAPETQEVMRTHGFEPEAGPPQAVTERIRSEIDKWRALAARTGIKPE
jgi:tripartite-type tricarboxylate transporter receptor subunit TctC